MTKLTMNKKAGSFFCCFNYPRSESTPWRRILPEKGPPRPLLVKPDYSGGGGNSVPDQVKSNGKNRGFFEVGGT